LKNNVIAHTFLCLIFPPFLAKIIFKIISPVHGHNAIDPYYYCAGSHHVGKVGERPGSADHVAAAAPGVFLKLHFLQKKSFWRNCIPNFHLCKLFHTYNCGEMYFMEH
jgi:hypothetical protein